MKVYAMLRVIMRQIFEVLVNLLVFVKPTREGCKTALPKSLVQRKQEVDEAVKVPIANEDMLEL
tara:strand:- start:14 stop:205 length:192 start_codon:yes stop_codon:yes gene_type:complete